MTTRKLERMPRAVFEARSPSVLRSARRISSKRILLPAVKPDDGGKDLFAHHGSIQGKSLKDGQKVSFDVTQEQPKPAQAGFFFPGAA